MLITPKVKFTSTLLLCILSSFSSSASGRLHNVSDVSQCIDVHLQAAYLAEEEPGGGSGFLLKIQNERDQAVAVPAPTPVSVHWYAQSGGRWLWRASSGSGGSLANALQERGPLLAGPGSPGVQSQTLRTIPAHSSEEWAVFAADDPALRYRPGCEHCTYQGEEQFRAVIAYAYRPSVWHAETALLRCGLRSNPVIMPPLPQSLAGAHNSTAPAGSLYQ